MAKKREPSPLSEAMKAAGFKSDQALADAADMERSRVTKIMLGQNASLLDVLALARVLAPHLRAEQLPMKERTRRELRALREREAA